MRVLRRRGAALAAGTRAAAALPTAASSCGGARRLLGCSCAVLRFASDPETRGGRSGTGDG